MRAQWKTYLVTALLIGVAVGPCAAIIPCAEQAKESMKISMVDLFTTDVQIVTEDAKADAWNGVYAHGKIENAESVAEKLEGKGWAAGVAACVSGLIDSAHSDNGPPMFLTGIHKDDEGVVRFVKKHIVDGNYFDLNVRYTKESGYWGTAPISTPLFKPYPAIISSERARSANLKVGDEFSITTVTDSSALSSGTFSIKCQVMGIYESSIPLAAKCIVYLPIESVREALQWNDNEGSAIHVISPYGNEDYGRMASDIGTIAPELAVVTWHDALVQYGGGMFDTISIVASVFSAIMACIAAAVAFLKGASSVKDRNFEIAILRVYGMRPSSISASLAWTGVMSGIGGAIFGIIIATVLGPNVGYWLGTAGGGSAILWLISGSIQIIGFASLFSVVLTTVSMVAVGSIASRKTVVEMLRG